MSEQSIELKLTVPQKMASASKPVAMVDFIAQHCSLSKMTIKKVLQNGGGWTINAKGHRRVRQAKFPLIPGTRVEFYYDPQIQIPSLEQVFSLYDGPQWGAWFKPASVLAQGTKYGDEGSLQRYLEKTKGSSVYLINRLDREVAGIMLIAYHRQWAAQLTALQGRLQLRKFYQLVCRGKFPGPQSITSSLDGKNAHTEILCSNPLQGEDCSQLVAEIKTGRYHQIRRHLAISGYPLLGDPRYGQRNKNSSGIQLLGFRLTLSFQERNYDWVLPDHLLLFPLRSSLPSTSVT